MKRFPFRVTTHKRLKLLLAKHPKSTHLITARCSLSQTVAMYPNYFKVRHRSDSFVGQSRDCNLLFNIKTLTKMKKYWILLTAALLLIVGVVLHVQFGNMFSAGTYCRNYFAAGDYAIGVFAAGKFSIGIFSAGIFSIGIFSIGLFNIGLYAIGFFILAWKKRYAKFLKREVE